MIKDQRESVYLPMVKDYLENDAKPYRYEIDGMVRHDGIEYFFISEYNPTGNSSSYVLLCDGRWIKGISSNPIIQKSFTLEEVIEKLADLPPGTLVQDNKIAYKDGYCTPFMYDSEKRTLVNTKNQIITIHDCFNDSEMPTFSFL